MGPKVSIVIPNYNYADYLPQAIESALNQTYDNKEVLVVDDGSTDSSVEIIRSYGSRVKFLPQDNQGVSAARNTGIAFAQGEFLLPLDADDYLEMRYLATTVPLMADPEVGIVSTDYNKFGVDNFYVSTWKLTLAQEVEGNGIPICSLIRRKAFDQTPGYTTTFVKEAGFTRALGYEDWNLWLDILKRGWKMAVVNEPLFNYRTKSFSVWTPAPPGGVSQEAFDALKRLHPDLYGAQ